jgi:MoaA/NifB/PqqE/SkfB family radical SAM enzyme
MLERIAHPIADRQPAFIGKDNPQQQLSKGRKNMYITKGTAPQATAHGPKAETGRCAFCFDPDKGCNRACKGEDCPNSSTCHRVMQPTIRITTRCTQQCSHCCFSCSPKADAMMTPATSALTASFLESNGIATANIMGGEFFCNPHWQEVLSALSATLSSARLVSNGDWAASKKTAHPVIGFLKENTNFRMSLSNDRYHTNRHIRAAAEMLSKEGLAHNVATEENATRPENIIPVGRAFLTYDSMYSMFGNYCRTPAHRYSFMIDEQGEVYRCPFGIWSYANIADYSHGGFTARFKEFNAVFQSAWIPNCTRCAMAAQQPTQPRKGRTSKP